MINEVSSHTLTNFIMTKSKKIILTFSLIGISYFFISYHSENKKYAIINEIFKDIDFNSERIYHSQLTVEFDNEVFKNFSLFDKISVYSQVAIQNLKESLHFSNEIKPNKITYKSGFSEILTDYPKTTIKIKENHRTILLAKEYYSISLPILSSDNKTAVMLINNYCGMLCGSGTVYIFKKVDGKWKVVEQIEKWIS